MELFRSRLLVLVKFSFSLKKTMGHVREFHVGYLLQVGYLVHAGRGRVCGGHLLVFLFRFAVDEFLYDAEEFLGTLADKVAVMDAERFPCFQPADRV